MKKVLLLLLFLNLTVFTQDIPNAGFENWTEGNPDNWIAYNLPSLWTTITQSADNHSGSYAARLEIVDFGGTHVPPILTGFVQVTQNYGSLRGYYKFLPQNEDQEFLISVLVYGDSGLVGGGSFEISGTVSAYTQFEAPITYLPGNADSVFIQFSVNDTSEAETGLGSYALIDDLSWGAVVGVEKINPNVPSEFKMQQNYPNPFNPSTMIEYSIPKESFVELKVYDIVGNELNTLVSEHQPAGNFRAEFNAADLSSGIYIAKLTAGSFTKSIKMTLLK